jgi:hypothetical protein
MMNTSLSCSLPSFNAAFANRTILRLNRIGIQHFHEGCYPEASRCFLSAIKLLKRLTTCSLGETSFGNECNNEVECQDAMERSRAHPSPLRKSERKGSVLQPMEPSSLQFVFNGDFCSTTVPEDGIYTRYTWIGFVLIYNLASTVHHHALSVTEQSPNRKVLVVQALRLYQCAFQGISNQEYNPASLHRSKDASSNQVILGQRLLLSVVHNMGLLLCDEEVRQNHHKIPSFSLPSAHRCFQVVFATIHSLRDYYGIQLGDFPAEFELQLVIDTALERLGICQGTGGEDDENTPGGHSATAPCA